MSSLIDCPACGDFIAANADKCIHCGYRRTSPVAWLFAIVLIVIFATAIFGSAQAQETGAPLAQEGNWYQKLTRDLGFVRSIAYASLYTIHYDPKPEHVNHQNMLGFELETEEKQVYGLAIFDNSFGQKSEYLYMGKKWHNFRSERMYFKLTGGLLHGYKEPYEDKIPLNDLGIAPALVPTLGYQHKGLFIEYSQLGLAAGLITAGFAF